MSVNGLSTGSTELVNSRALLGDWRALRGPIGEGRYVFMRGVLDPMAVEAVGADAARSLQAAGWTESGGDARFAPPQAPARAVRMRDALADPGYRRILADPGFAKIPFVSPLARLMAEILGPAGFCYPFKLPRVVYPVTVVPRQPGNVVHKDYRAVQDMFTSWVPLGPVPVRLGGLALRPGSHHGTSVHHRPLVGLEPGWRTADYEPGDVLVFHCLTTHAALPNRDDRLRISAEYRWQLADQPAPRRMVVGRDGREIGSRLFGRTGWWRPVPRGLALFDDGGADGPRLLPAAPSRFVGPVELACAH